MGTLSRGKLQLPWATGVDRPQAGHEAGALCDLVKEISQACKPERQHKAIRTLNRRLVTAEKRTSTPLGFSRQEKTWKPGVISEWIYIGTFS